MDGYVTRGALRLLKRTALRSGALAGVVFCAALSTQLVYSTLAPSAAQADQPAPAASPVVSGDQTLIGDDAFNGASGIIGINEAAGTGNVQANAGLIGAGAGSVRISQRTDAVGTGRGSTTITANAFGGATGLVRINQVSGTGNAQANVVIVHWGISGNALGDDVLAGTLPQQSTSPGNRQSSDGQQAVSVDKTAFAGTRGIVQLSQVAGSGNSTINDLSLQIHVGVTSLP